MSSVSPADTGCSMESPAPDQHDPHSSEEELEVINSPPRPPRSSSVCLPEKRKWSQVGSDSYSIHHCSRRSPCENEENVSRYGNLSPPSPSSPSKCCGAEDGTTTVHYHHHHNHYHNHNNHHSNSNGHHHHHHHHNRHSSNIEHSGSSDEEVHNLLASMATPVQFRTSPPLEALKPGGRTPINYQNRIRSMSPPAKLLHYEVSPRKRSRHTKHTHVQRPYLDFEKMQQVRKKNENICVHYEIQ
ncbi:hypothetical protein AMK59_2846 [Oryctes borbonicus]|uniref:Uncharacterized protein n=1 Tax=Oryctes borbonicus TaxID=1629725 RepID=A0A0T6BF35_9SCAR|nr:hypothetical protein AMK59_2846 [Oryctes borbonicus]